MGTNRTDSETASTPAEVLKRAVAVVGSQSAMGRLLGISQTAVWKWVDGDKHLPAEFVLKVEEATGISRHDLRPDLYPIEDPSAVRSIPFGGAVGACDRPSGLQLGEAVR